MYSTLAGFTTTTLFALFPLGIVAISRLETEWAPPLAFLASVAYLVYYVILAHCVSDAIKADN